MGILEDYINTSKDEPNYQDKRWYYGRQYLDYILAKYGAIDTLTHPKWFIEFLSTYLTNGAEPDRISKQLGINATQLFTLFSQLKDEVESEDPEDG